MPHAKNPVPLPVPLSSGIPDFTPVPRAKSRSNGLDPARQRAFIAALAETGVVTLAVEAVGVSAAALYRLRRARGGEEFAAAWDAALALPAARAARWARRDGLRRAPLPPLLQRRGSETWQAAGAPSRSGVVSFAAGTLSAKMAAPPPPPTPSSEEEGALSCSSVRPSRRTSRTAFRGLPPAPDDPLLSFAPVPHKAPRSNSITALLQRAFIAQLAATGIVTQAARHIGKSLEALYKLRHRPGAEEFSAAWEAAVDLGVARLEDCALARAIEGEERPLVALGEVIGTWRKHNEALVMFLLRQRRSGRYSDRVDLKPGNAVYERLKAEILADAAGDEDEIHASINAKLDAMIARKKSLAEWERDPL
jgi:hypothetical protein